MASSAVDSANAAGTNETPKTIRDVATRKDSFSVPFRSIEIREGWNTRDYSAQDVKDHIEWLKNQAFIDGGLRDPWRGYWDKDSGKFINTDAHCRFLAVQKGIKEGLGTDDFLIPVILEDKNATEVDYLETMLLSNSGLPLKPLEKAIVYRRLVEAGRTDAEIAKVDGVTRQTATNIRMLAHATPKVIQLLKEGKVKPTTVFGEIRKAAGETLDEKGQNAEADILHLVKTAETLGVKATGDAAEQLRQQKGKSQKAASKADETQAGKDYNSGQGSLTADPNKPQIQKFSKMEREMALNAYVVLKDALPQTTVEPKGRGESKVAVFTMPWEEWKKLESSF